MKHLLPLLLCVGCYEARVAELDRQMELLEADIEETREVLAHMETGVKRALQNVAPRQEDRTPRGFDGSKPLPAGDPDRPDIVLVSIDTLRADHLGTYGYQRDTSPFMDSLAQEGTRFDSAWASAPWTLPSHTTMLSGLLPSNHEAIEDHVHISSAVPLISEVFQRNGYATTGVVATMFVSSKFGFERGFDFFHDFGVNDKRTNNLSTVDAVDVFSHALHWAQQQPEGKPLFAFLHVYDVHYGYNAPPPWNEKFDRPPKLGDAVYKSYYDYKKKMVSDAQLAHQVAQYDEEIAYVDYELQRLVERWRRAGRDLIVVVTADHGEEFGERGSWGHAHTLYKEQLHVPLIVNGPGIAQSVITERVGGEDIAPTLAGLAGLALDNVDGVDRSAQLRAGASVQPVDVPGRLAETSRFDTLTYRWHEPPYDLVIDMRRASRGLCNIVVDPWCRKNLYKTEKARGEQMFASMTEYLGQPWMVLEKGTVRTPKGTFMYSGTDRFKGEFKAEPGQRFAVHPADGLLAWIPDGGEKQGPYRAFGNNCSHPPAGLRYDGPECDAEGGVELTDADRAALEALGYLQPEAEEAEGSEAPPG